ncbi:MAG: hypothetical protein LAP87_08640 [Acidobacteriia bacterium]|nr:hypothetical protein [Terriglobia bacterium]
MQPVNGAGQVVAASAVQEQLRAILVSPPFSRSERMQAFLTYVVEETLAGRGDELKEYAIAVDVFRRTESYDSKSDALVRVEARRLRRKLQEFYLAAGPGASILIELPKGSYKAVFSSLGASVPSVFRPWTWAVGSLLLLAVLAAAAFLLGRPLENPAFSFGTDARARDSYWQGVYLRKERTEDSLRKSIQFFERAVARQPGNARAQAALADGYAWLAFFHLAPWRETTAKAKAAAALALRSDAAMPEAWEALGLVALFKEWDWLEAERCFRRALDAAPSSSAVHHSYALGLAAHGRFDEAAAEARRAFDLDPSSYVANNDVAVILYCARRYQEAAENARRTQAVRPNWAPGYAMTGLCEAARDRFPEALAAFRRGVSLSGNDPYYVGRLGNALARSGDRTAALDTVAGLERRALAEFVPHLNLAWTYIGLGDFERVFDHLRQAIDGRETDVLFLGVEPIYDPLRADPRFHALLQQAGLVPQPNAP